MELSSILYPLLGGCLIGISVTIMLIFNGRVTGISGILASSLSRQGRDGVWRWLFIAGMILGGIVMTVMQPALFTNLTDRSTTTILIAGLLVGYGTVMGSGCTSGHGICGMSRFSVRSVIATLTFMLFGFMTVQAVRYLTGGLS